MDQNQTNSQKPYNLEPNVEAAMSYLLGPITGVMVYLLEKENKFVRFHAMQSIIFSVVVFIAMQLATFSIALLIGILLVPVVSVGSFIVWLMLMYKAYNNEEWELPYIGKIAKDQI